MDQDRAAKLQENRLNLIAAQARAACAVDRFRNQYPYSEVPEALVEALHWAERDLFQVEADLLAVRGTP